MNDYGQKSDFTIDVDFRMAAIFRKFFEKIVWNLGISN